MVYGFAFRDFFLSHHVSILQKMSRGSFTGNREGKPKTENWRSTFDIYGQWSNDQCQNVNGLSRDFSALPSSAESRVVHRLIPHSSSFKLQSIHDVKLEVKSSEWLACIQLSLLSGYSLLGIIIVDLCLYFVCCWVRHVECWRLSVELFSRLRLSLSSLYSLHFAPYNPNSCTICRHRLSLVLVHCPVPRSHCPSIKTHCLDDSRIRLSPRYF